MTNLPPPTKPKPPASKPPGKTGTFKRVTDDPARHFSVLYAQEGFGKTSVLAHAPNPLIILSPQETGYITLRKAGRVPDVPYADPATFAEFKSLLSSDDIRSFDTICIDTLSGFWRALTEYVLKREFSNDPLKYANYGKGNASASMQWQTLLPVLESLKQHVDIIAACHSEIETFDAPDGEAYKRYSGAMFKTAWGDTKAVADAVLFGTFFTSVEDGKAKGGTDRVVYTTHRAAHDAKNRYGMKDMLTIPNDHSKVYSTIFNPIKESNNAGR